MPSSQSKPLAGRGVLVTRPAKQAARLAGLISEAGGRPILFPAIEIRDLPERTLPPLEEFDLAVFASPIAVAKALERRPNWPSTLAVAAVGPGTRRELERAGFQRVLAPRHGADSEALLALPELAGIAGKKILLVRGEDGRELLAAMLAARGASVTRAELYRRVAPHADPAALLRAWGRGEVDAVTLFSSQALHNLMACLGDAGLERLRRTPLFVVHERIAERARAAGAREVLLAAPGDDEIVARVMAYFGPR